MSTTTVTEEKPPEAAAALDEPGPEPSAEPTEPSTDPVEPADTGDVAMPVTRKTAPKAPKAAKASKAPANRKAQKKAPATKAAATASRKKKAAVVAVERKPLQDAVKAARRAAANQPPFGYLRVEVGQSTLRITGYDGDLAVTRTAKVTGRQSAVTYVPAKLLDDVAGACPEDNVGLTISEDGIDVCSGDYEAKLTGRLAELAWSLPPKPVADIVELNAVEVANALGRVLHAASKDDQRPLLCSVGVDTQGDKALVWATDSYRLAVGEAPPNWPAVPFGVRTVRELAGFAGSDLADTIEMRLGEKFASFKLGAVTLQTTLMDPSGVDWRPLVVEPLKAPVTWSVERAALAQAVRRVDVGGNDTAVKLRIKGGEVNVTLTHEGTVHAAEPVPVELEGADELTVAFNPAFLTQALGALEDDRVTLTMTDGLKPTLIHEGDPEHRFELLMPVRAA